MGDKPHKVKHNSPMPTCGAVCAGIYQTRPYNIAITRTQFSYANSMFSTLPCSVIAASNFFPHVHVPKISQLDVIWAGPILWGFTPSNVPQVHFLVKLLGTCYDWRLWTAPTIKQLKFPGRPTSPCRGVVFQGPWLLQITQNCHLATKG